jgi:hypothetical protein
MIAIEIWVYWTALAVGGLCATAIALMTWHGRREPGTPAPEIQLDVTPITDDPSALALVKCPHDVPLNRHCDACEGVLRGKHITLDGEPASEDTAVIAPEPRVPPPPPVSGVIGRMKPPGGAT